MKINKLFACVFTTLALFYVQPTYAWLAQCQIAADSMFTFITCASDPAGGYITVRNISPITAPQIIHVFPNDAPGIELKPNAVSRLIYVVAGLRIECDGCTSKNVAVSIATQCTQPPTAAERNRLTCK